MAVLFHHLFCSVALHHKWKNKISIVVPTLRHEIVPQIVLQFCTSECTTDCASECITYHTSDRTTECTTDCTSECTSDCNSECTSGCSTDCTSDHTTDRTSDCMSLSCPCLSQNFIWASPGKLSISSTSSSNSSSSNSSSNSNSSSSCLHFFSFQQYFSWHILMHHPPLWQVLIHKHGNTPHSCSACSISQSSSAKSYCHCQSNRWNNCNNAKRFHEFTWKILFSLMLWMLV